MVITWIGHLAAALFAVAFMMLALGLHLFWLGRPPPTTCGRVGTGGCPCSADARSRCAEARNRGSI